MVDAPRRKTNSQRYLGERWSKEDEASASSLHTLASVSTTASESATLADVTSPVKATTAAGTEQS